MGDNTATFRTVASGYSLLTAGVWDGAAEQFAFADAANGGVSAVRSDGAVTTVLPHRRGVGGLALHADGGYVVSGRNVALKNREHTASLLELDPSLGLTRFNDLTTDAAGRIYVGSLEFDPNERTRRPRPGYLHLIDLDGTARIIDEGIGTANGLVVSPDGTRLYLADTWAATIWMYDRAPDGDVSNRRAFLLRPHGELDGLAITTDGVLWIAVGEPDDALLAVDPDGRPVAEVPVPAGHVTSIVFADDGRAFVTAAHEVLETHLGVLAPEAKGVVRAPAAVRAATAPDEITSAHTRSRG